MTPLRAFLNQQVAALNEADVALECEGCLHPGVIPRLGARQCQKHKRVNEGYSRDIWAATTFEQLDEARKKAEHASYSIAMETAA